MKSAQRAAVGFGVAKLLLQLVALTPYGYFRDEMYYLACANHLALGYVDQPPFSVALLAIWRAFFGDSIAAIRLVPALAGAALVYLTGRLVIALGGNIRAVALACLAVLAAPLVIAFDHFYSMNALDGLLWVAAALLFTQRRWTWLGVVLGLGLSNKLSVLWLGAGIAAALVVTDRAALKTRGPWLAAAIAGALFAPSMWWQWHAGWPMAEFARNAMKEKYVHLSPLAFFAQITLMMNAATLPLVVAGVMSRKGRALAIIFAVAVLIVAVSGGKPEYLHAAYPLAFASGAIALTEWRKLPRIAVPILGVAIAVFGLLILPMVLPVLSEEAYIAYSKRLGLAPTTSEKKELAELPQLYADMHGWPELVDAAERAYQKLAPDERANAKIWAVTGGYGPAAAIDLLGAHRGLPHAIAGHNNYWLWGYGTDDDAPVIALGGKRERLQNVFERVDQVDTIECGYCMPYENHKPVFILRHPKEPWRDLWPELKHYE